MTRRLRGFAVPVLTLALLVAGLIVTDTPAGATPYMLRVQTGTLNGHFVSMWACASYIAANGGEYETEIQYQDSYPAGDTAHFYEGGPVVATVQEGQSSVWHAGIITLGPYFTSRLGYPVSGYPWGSITSTNKKASPVNTSYLVPFTLWRAGYHC